MIADGSRSARATSPPPERLFTGFLAGIAPENHLHRHLTQVRLAEVSALAGRRRTGGARITAASRAARDLARVAGRRRAPPVTPSPPPRSASTIRRLRSRECSRPWPARRRIDAAFALAEQRRARLLTDRLNQAEALREGGSLASAPAHRARPVDRGRDRGSAARQRDGDPRVRRRQRGRADHALHPHPRRGAGDACCRAWTRSRPPYAGWWRCWRSGGRPDALAKSLGAALLEPGRRRAAARGDAAGGDPRRSAPPGAVRRAPARRRAARRRALGDRPRALRQPRRLALAQARHRPSRW